MDVEPSLLAPQPLSQNSKEGRNSKLLPYLQSFFDILSFPCPHTNKQTMPYSINSLWKTYNGLTDKPCSLSPSCFRWIWKNYFWRKYVKARQRDGLCQLCEIRHKIDKISENSVTLLESKKKNSIKK
jgi:hypothetical protein